VRPRTNCIRPEGWIYSGRSKSKKRIREITVIKADPQTKKSSKAAPSVIDLRREIGDLGWEFGAPLEPQAVMDAIVDRLVKRYGVGNASLWLLGKAAPNLQLAASAGLPKLPPGFTEASLKNSLLGKAAREQLPQMLEAEAAQGDELSAWAKENQLVFVAAYPLVEDSKVKGVLLVACAKTPPGKRLVVFQLHAWFASVALRDAELRSSEQQTLSKLQFLMEATKALASTLDLGELLGRILEVAKAQADAERGTLFLVDEKSEEIWSLIAHGMEKREIRLPLGRGIAGYVAQSGEILNIPDAYADPRFNRDVDAQTGYRTRNILCLPIRNKSGKIIAALQLLNKRSGGFTSEDVDFLLTLSDHMALALENAQLHRALLEKERLEREMALARDIQRSLLPEGAPLVPGFDIAVTNEPCYEVGGDYYDFLTLGPDSLLVVVADVEGKGISSAMIMSNLQATLRALALNLHSLSSFAESLNHMMLAGTRGGKYFTMFLGLIDVQRQALDYINCGHVPPVIVRIEGEDVNLTEGGMVVGLIDNVRYQQGQVKFQTGDVLVLCTDGITESMDEQQEEYGTERLVNCVRGAMTQNAAEIVTTVNADVARFSVRGTHLDDKVLIAVKVT
jgi:phosphoserine phosphatase RsbU/P